MAETNYTEFQLHKTGAIMKEFHPGKMKELLLAVPKYPSDNPWPSCRGTVALVAGVHCVVSNANSISKLVWVWHQGLIVGNPKMKVKFPEEITNFDVDKLWVVSYPDRTKQEVVTLEDLQAVTYD